MERQPSTDIDDHHFFPAWDAYRKSPSLPFGASGFSEAGVQRIDLPFDAGELDRVAAWLDEVSESGMTALRPFHRLGTQERLSTWKAAFGSLDLGEYDEIARVSDDRLAPKTRVVSSTAAPTNWARMDAALMDASPTGAAHLASLRWSVLLIEPNRFFPCHAHPNVELIYCARGALYENRVLPSALYNRIGAREQPIDQSTLRRVPRRVPRRAPGRARRADRRAEIVDSGFPKFFRVNKHVGGSVLCNPRHSVHQSYTLDEGAVLLVLWCGRHANLADPDGLLWDPDRCQNPHCPLACPDKTFEALARNAARRSNLAEV